MHHFLIHYYPIIAPIARGATVTAIVIVGLLLLWLIPQIPLRVRIGAVRIDGLLKLCGWIFILGWCIAAAYVTVRFPLLIAAKLWIINLLLVGIIGCWFFLLTSRVWSDLLTDVQQECELATNLVFLQGEVARSQLESLSEKIRAAAQPEEREITETMLKTLSPVVMLFLHKERSVVKWSMAAMNLSKGLMSYFMSPKK